MPCIYCRFIVDSWLTQVAELFAAAKKLGFAIPAVNVTSSSSANAVMEAAASLNSPIVLQVGGFTVTLIIVFVKYLPSNLAYSSIEKYLVTQSVN